MQTSQSMLPGRFTPPRMINPCSAYAAAKVLKLEQCSFKSVMAAMAQVLPGLPRSAFSALRLPRPPSAFVGQGGDGRVGSPQEQGLERVLPPAPTCDLRTFYNKVFLTECDPVVREVRASLGLSSSATSATVAGGHGGAGATSVPPTPAGTLGAAAAAAAAGAAGGGGSTGAGSEGGRGLSRRASSSAGITPLAAFVAATGAAVAAPASLAQEPLHSLPLPLLQQEKAKDFRDAGREEGPCDMEVDGEEAKPGQASVPWAPPALLQNITPVQAKGKGGKGKGRQKAQVVQLQKLQQQAALQQAQQPMQQPMHVLVEEQEGEEAQAQVQDGEGDVVMAEAEPVLVPVSAPGGGAPGARRALAQLGNANTLGAATAGAGADGAAKVCAYLAEAPS